MLLYSDHTYAINGAAFHVYNKLGLLYNFGCSDELEMERIVI